MTIANDLNKPKSRLGRGLTSLLANSALPVEAEIPAEKKMLEAAGWPILLSVDAVTVNPHQPRREFNEESLQALSRSIQANGLIQPIIVRKVGTAYELIAGERRLRAAKLAGLSAISAVIHEADAFSQAQLALIENIHREDLNPLERALAYRALMGQLNLTQQALAGRIGEDRSTIANFLRLLELSEPVQNAVRAGKLSHGHAKVLAAVSDPTRQIDLAKQCELHGWSVRALEEAIRTPAATSCKHEKLSVKPPSAHLVDLEKTVARQVGCRVQIRSQSKGKGKLVLHYSSLDQFDELLHRLGVKLDEN